MRAWLRGLLVVAVLVAVASAVPASVAQTSNGTIAGTVTDRTGAAVVGATVEIVSSDRGGTPRVLETDGVGSYRAEAILPGVYVVALKKQGFSDLKISLVEVKASLTTTVNGVLEVSGQAATVLVEASTGQELQTQSGDLSANISSEEVHSLPINGLNPIALVLTQPGVQDPETRGISNGVNFSVNGSRPRANNFLIDGQDNNDNAINGQAFQTTNQEAIAEVSILQNSYSAEFGRGGGSVTNEIIKSGTNQWHGSAVEIHQNSAVGAIPADSKLAGVTRNPV